MIKEYEEEKTLPLASPRQYGLSQKHKHLPEIMKVCKLCETPLFSPIVADYYAGMEVTVGFHTGFLQLPCGLPGDITLEDFHSILKTIQGLEIHQSLPALDRGNQCALPRRQ